MLKKMGYHLYGTDNTEKFLNKNGVECTRVEWPSLMNGSTSPESVSAEQLIRDGKVDLCINLPNETSKMLAGEHIM